MPEPERVGWRCPECSLVFSPNIAVCYLCSASAPLPGSQCIDAPALPPGECEQPLELTIDLVIDGEVVNHSVHDLYWERTYKSIRRRIW